MAYQFNPFTSKFDIVTDISGAELLDGTNQPSTGNKNISKVDPEHRLTDTGNSEYTRITRADTSNVAQRFNRVSVPATGNPGNGLSFNAAGRYEAPHSASLNVGNNMSVELWNKPTALGGLQVPLIKWASGNYWMVRWDGNNITFIPHASSPVATYLTTGQNGVWSHIVGTYDGVTVRLYFNGTEVDNKAWAGGTNQNTNPVGIGGINTVGTQEFLGVIDEVRVYNRTLSPTEVSDRYNGGTGLYGYAETGLVAGWHLDESSGTIAADYSGNSNTASKATGTQTWVTGKVLLPASSSMAEVSVWKSEDGVNNAEQGIQTFGNSSGRTILNGADNRFQINAVEKARFDSVGSLGIGTTAPTAYLHIKAGAAAASSAPLKLTSGTNLTIAEAGAMEYNGTNLFFTRTGTTREGVLVGNRGATAPATAAIGVIADYYGTSATRVLTTPNTWFSVVGDDGAVYKIPAYS